MKVLEEAIRELKIPGVRWSDVSASRCDCTRILALVQPSHFAAAGAEESGVMCAMAERYIESRHDSARSDHILCNGCDELRSLPRFKRTHVFIGRRPAVLLRLACSHAARTLKCAAGLD